MMMDALDHLQCLHAQIMTCANFNCEKCEILFQIGSGGCRIYFFSTHKIRIEMAMLMVQKVNPRYLV